MCIMFMDVNACMYAVHMCVCMCDGGWVVCNRGGWDDQ